MMRAICVFCGSKLGNNPAYREGAVALGEALAAQEITLVYGGGSVGLMGTIADTVLAKGGTVKGVIPEALNHAEVAHQGLQELHVVDSMHTRKAMMAQLSDAFIAMPGGYGTFEELFEVITWAQLGIQPKPIGLLNIEGYYDPFHNMIQHAVQEGFIHPKYLQLFLRETEPSSLLARLHTHNPPPPVLDNLTLASS